MFLGNTASRPTGLAFLLALVLGGCSVAGTPRDEAAPAPGKATGYLDKADAPDSLRLVPPPPAAGSPGMALDEAVSRQALSLRDTPRFAQATQDAELSFPAGARQFACALGVPVDAQRTPHLYALLERSRIDASAATKAAKNHYRRARPFMVNGEPTCTPEDEDGLRHNGSYPSGHSAIGWAWALILVEVAPERTDDLLDRGRNYAESRLVCNVHWQSDILEGRHMGAAAVARLHDNAAFRADLDAARKEVAAARAAGLKPAEDCDAQAQRLKARPESAL
ncbi:phosphatase PAP2 family protein [Stenotrophomonas sp. HITSZ_GD]|uniref:acid phosphatase n=1 Tax=Stenotrophomonas sp. HITSZ_GD TaxID=3037248 RepID=UPI00240CF7B4|nr:phosphatase PAP2 family protein [Stenotrophomonas sp. HITSZ_GD]MDG2523953.1 phosphatase PAP2 family protein [Stenotrophomonas sp. HITSZ_GD]